MAQLLIEAFHADRRLTVEREPDGSVILDSGGRRIEVNGALVAGPIDRDPTGPYFGVGELRDRKRRRGEEDEPAIEHVEVKAGGRRIEVARGGSTWLAILPRGVDPHVEISFIDGGGVTQHRMTVDTTIFERSGQRADQDYVDRRPAPIRFLSRLWWRLSTIGYEGYGPRM